MQRRNTHAGGFFLVAAILAGAVVGAMNDNPMGGLLVGTVLGVALAVMIWLLDRRRG